MSTEIVCELVDGEWVTTVAAGGGSGGSQTWEEVAVPTDEASWSEIDPAGNWDFTDGVITYTNEGIGTVKTILTTTDHFGQAWAVECEIAVVDATQAFANAFNAGAWIYNAESLQEFDGSGFEFINQEGGATVSIFNNLYGNDGSTIATFDAPDSAYHTIRVINLPLVQQAYFDGVLVGQNFTAPNSGSIQPTDGLKESRFLLWDASGGNTASFRNLKAWRIPLPTFP